MRFLFLLILLTGCDYFVAINNETKAIQATCNMGGFKGFPEKITGLVTLELKNYITILVENEDKTEKVEITFPKSKCGVN